MYTEGIIERERVKGMVGWVWLILSFIGVAIVAVDYMMNEHKRTRNGYVFRVWLTGVMVSIGIGLVTKSILFAVVFFLPVTVNGIFAYWHYRKKEKSSNEGTHF